MKHIEVFQKLVDYLIDQEETSYEEYLVEEFPEIEPEDYYEIRVYGRDDINHIFAYTLQARDYLLEDVTYELGT